MSVLVATPRPVTRWRPSTVVAYVLLIALAVFYLLPMFAIVVTSLKSFTEVSRSTLWELPRAPTLEAFGSAFDVLAPAFVNSVLLVVPATALSALLGSLNGYVLSKWKFRGANVIFALLLFGMFIPYQSILIPLFQFLSAIGLYGGIPGLILVHVVYGIPICTLIFRNYFATVPRELLEAARMDGASVLGIFRHIMLPISIPGFVVTIIWQFTSSWNDYLFAIFLSNTRNGPITIALNALAGAQSPDYAASMAGALITSLPTLLVYILLGRWFIGGLMAGSVKS